MRALSAFLDRLCKVSGTALVDEYFFRASSRTSERFFVRRDEVSANS
jgi:hypothetical protein